MTPPARTATRTGAASSPGPRADLLLVDGDPTGEITATRTIRTVRTGGVPLDRESRRVP